MHSGETEYCLGVMTLSSIRNTFGCVKWHDPENLDHDRFISAHGDISWLGPMCVHSDSLYSCLESMLIYEGDDSHSWLICDDGLHLSFVHADSSGLFSEPMCMCGDL